MAADTTLNANIRTNIPEEMRRAGQGFNNAASGARNLENGVRGAASQMANLEKNTALAAAAAQRAAFQTKLGQFAAGGAALGGAIPMFMGGQQNFASLFAARGASMAMGGAQVGGAIGGPWGAVVGAGIGLATAGAGAWTESKRLEEERGKQLTQAMVDLVEELKNLDNLRGQAVSVGADTDLLDMRLQEVTGEIKKLREQGGVDEGKVGEQIAKMAAQKALEASVAGIKDAVAQGAKEGTEAGSKGSAVQLEVLKADQLQKRSFTAGLAGVWGGR